MDIVVKQCSQCHTNNPDDNDQCRRCKSPLNLTPTTE